MGLFYGGANGGQDDERWRACESRKRGRGVSAAVPRALST